MTTNCTRTSVAQSFDCYNGRGMSDVVSASGRAYRLPGRPTVVFRSTAAIRAPGRRARTGPDAFAGGNAGHGISGNHYLDPSGQEVQLNEALVGRPHPAIYDWDLSHSAM